MGKIPKKSGFFSETECWREQKCLSGLKLGHTGRLAREPMTRWNKVGLLIFWKPFGQCKRRQARRSVDEGSRMAASELAELQKRWAEMSAAYTQ